MLNQMFLATILADSHGADPRIIVLIIAIVAGPPLWAFWCFARFTAKKGHFYNLSKDWTPEQWAEKEARDKRLVKFAAGLAAYDYIKSDIKHEIQEHSRLQSPDHYQK